MWQHSDATITALAIDASGHVPWWPRPDVKLFTILIHMLTETSRHAVHADILREQLDGSTGLTAEDTNRRDPAFWAARRETIERAARTVNPTKYSMPSTSERATITRMYPEDGPASDLA